ncbi:MAG: hypothetical protein VKS61_14570, partial [Candidatus Sericytochromatia bacterium]|nr:hypothetical protein [Candidatus Sericytochromatia bacterium]
TPTATLLAGWVETQVLASQPDPAAALDRLTPEAARQADEAARAALSAEALAGAAWRPDKLAAAANAAGEQNQALAAALQEVRRLMTLAGVDACAPGGLARQTPLQLPIAVAATKAGDIFVASGSVGGITRIAAADGRMSFNAGACVRLGTDEVTTPPFEQLVAAPDGWLYAGSRNGRGVWRLQPPDGAPEPWLGGGEVVAAPGVARRDVKLHAVTDVAAAPDGGLWVSDQPKQSAPGARLLRIDASGSVVAVWRNGLVAATEGGDALLPEGRIVALAAGPDGTLWGLQRSATLKVWRRKPGDEAFRSFEVDTVKDLDFRYCRLLAMPDGSVLMSASDSGRSRSHKVLRIGPDGSVATYAGVGPIGYDTEPPTLATAHFNRPSGMALDAQGRVLVADYGNAQLRRIDSQQNRVEAIAGGRDTNEVVALQAGLNLPAGVAFTPDGQLLVTEVGGNALRRLEGDTLRRIAGGMGGVAGNGGPTSADRLGNPTALACTGDHAFLVELFGPRLRRLDLRTNVIETLTGTHLNADRDALQPDARPSEVAWTSIAALTIDAKGRPIFAAVAPSAPKRAIIWRLEDGKLTRLVGSERNDAPPAADGASALDATLGLVGGLTYDARGNLYFAEATQGIVWRLDPAGTLHKVAGRGQVETLLRIVDGQAAAEADVPREEATLLMPIGLAADPAGNVYVAELGTRGLAVFADSMEIDLGAVLGEGVQVPELRGRLRKLTPEGRAITLAGTGSPAAPGGVMNPVSVAVDPKTGRVVFVDFGTGQVKEVVGGQAQGR